MMITTNKKSKLIFKTEDSFGEKIYKILETNYKIDYKNNTFFCEYEDDFGRCEILLELRKLKIERKGKIKNEIFATFDGKKQSFLYCIDNMSTKFSVLGNDFDFDFVKKILTFSYSIYDADTQINKIKFSFKEMGGNR